jgi:uncharacterized protein
MDEGDKKSLLELARESIYSVLDKEEPYLEPYEKYKEGQGCFVTLHKGKKLRGCIGYTEPIYPMYKLISEAAKAAAFSDPRFHPVRKEELPNISIEISLLTKPKLVVVASPEDYLKNIVIGRDGVILKGKYGSGLLLPQVAIEHEMTVDQFLNAVAQKAGLSFSAWKDLNNQVFTFQAEIFKEKE